MFIAILNLATAAADRPAALAALDEHCAEVQAMPGNQAYRVHASRENATDVVIMHEWDDEGSFAAYPTTEAFARLNRVLGPLLTGAPVTRRFDARPLDAAR